MADKNDTIGYICVPQSTGNSAIILQFIALPFHLLMMKILVKDLRLALPRHKITFSLSLSDCLLISVISLSAVIMKTLSLTTESMACQFLRHAALFTGTLSTVVSGLTITLMSIERYIACVHSFRLHQIMTKQIVLFVLSFSWVIATISGILAVATNKDIQAEVAVGESVVFKLTLVICSFSTSLIITIIQIRLLMFSRSKLVMVRPSKAFGTQAELADFRKRQIKVSFVAGIVAVAYIACMSPVAFLFLCELVDGRSRSASLKAAFLALCMVNTLADPFIYGVGTVDTRRLIVKDLKNIREVFVNGVMAIARIAGEFSRPDLQQ